MKLFLYVMAMPEAGAAPTASLTSDLSGSMSNSSELPSDPNGSTG